MKKAKVAKALRRNIRSRHAAKKRVRDVKRTVLRSGGATGRDGSLGGITSEARAVSLAAYGTGRSMHRATRIFGAVALVVGGVLLFACLMGYLLGSI